MTKIEYDRMLERLSEQRWKDFEAGEPEYNPSFPVETATEIPAGLDSIGAEFWEYYALKRGHHPRARGGFSETSHLSFISVKMLMSGLLNRKSFISYRERAISTSMIVPI